jgi:hypothetical protein
MADASGEDINEQMKEDKGAKENDMRRRFI